MKLRVSASTFAVLFGLAAGTCWAQQPHPAASQQHFHHLEPTPKTVAWGYYDAAAKPVLRVKSGDTVEVHTLLTSSPTRLEGAGVAPKAVEQELRDIYDQVKDKGPGGHILTGPIFVEGAEPGDVLEIRIKAIRLAIPYAYNGFGRTSGFIPEDFPYSKMKIIPLDSKRMIARFAPGVEIPLHPFFGSIGDAPPPSSGRLSSTPSRSAMATPDRATAKWTSPRSKLLLSGRSNWLSARTCISIGPARKRRANTSLWG